ncbi:MAG: ABC transporter permease [Thermoflexales bacterium]|nr:ABC transporter permease [Thermoflexales bacterium]MDW8352800.1 ABC transporter permease [Anaerolineae bacterium]
MESGSLLVILATAIAFATPLVFACIGETITERAGVINLSAEGTIMLCAMVGFVAAKVTDNVWVGFVAAAIIGALIALIVAYGAITLKQSQIAIGFVLALLCSDLSAYLGNPYVRVPGPTVPPRFPIPILQDIPLIGPLFFREGDILVYAGYLLIIAAWFYFYRTRGGLTLRAIGEQPAAAFARGHNVIALRYAYTMIGGALMGIAGAAFSLDFKAGWSYRHTAGYGWIALAIVIFGGWNPLRVALGAYLFGVLQSLASVVQSAIPDLPTQMFTVAPFVLMILVLVLTSSDWLDRLLNYLPVNARRAFLRAIHAAPPAALGRPFEQD